MQRSKSEEALALSELQGPNGPALFFKNVLGIDTLEKYQEEKILKTIGANSRTLIKACHDLGKSYTMARVALWFVSVFGYSKVITTAPTFNQVQNILWSEMRSAHARSEVPLGGKMNLTEYKLDDEWFCLGFSPKKEVSGSESQTSSSFQGFHAQGGILVIFDEATGIPAEIWKMAEGLMTQANVKFVCIGNPTSMASEFYRKHKSKFWAKVSLSCFDSPNLIANGLTDMKKLKREVEYCEDLNDDELMARLDSYKVTRPYLLTARWVVERLIEWGFDHPLSVSKIFGEFPEESDDTLISLGSVEAARLRVYFPTSSDRKIVGVDVARFGADATVLTATHGKKVVAKKKVRGKDTMEVAGHAIAFAREHFGNDVDLFVVDETGLGAGVVDKLNEEISSRLNEALSKASVRGVQFGERNSMSAKDKAKYFNLKARMFGLLADDMKAENGIVLLDESVYDEELPMIKKKYNGAGQLVIESKDDFKKRTGRPSPDDADSLALANFGRYDELEVGTFGNEFTNTVAPLAVRLGGQKKW